MASTLSAAMTLMLNYSSHATEILTSSARDYAESRGKRLSDYEMKGVQGRTFLTHCFVELLKEAPKNTEVIVDYKYQPISVAFANLSVDACQGTALIPKK